MDSREGEGGEQSEHVVRRAGGVVAVPEPNSLGNEGLVIM